jgi:uncharacterized protein YoxC
MLIFKYTQINIIMKNVLKLTFAFVILLLSSCSKEKTVDDELKEAAATMNEMTPQILSEGVRLDSVSAGHLSLKYNYTLTEDVKGNVSSAEIDSFKLLARDEAMKGLKTSKDMAELKGHKVKFKYSYYDKNGKLTADFSVTPVDYN